MWSSLFPRIAALTLTAMVALTCLAPTSMAHAVIIRSIPTVNAELTAADTDIQLQYNSRIDHQRSRLTVIDAAGKAEVVPIQPDSPADVILAKLPGLAPGQYRLRWQVLAVDGHLTRGDIPFSVKSP